MSMMVAAALLLVAANPALATTAKTSAPPAACSAGSTVAAQAKAEAAERGGDLAAAAKDYLVAANCGLGKAQRQIGLMLLVGRGVPKNESTAAEWLNKAAQQGDALGQLALGTVLRHGTGVPKNETSAHQWYLAAANQGVAMAQYHVGTQFIRGRGAAMDQVEGAKWFYRSALGGYPLAQMAMAHFEMMAFATDRNKREHLVRAYSWARLASRQTCSSTFKPTDVAAGLEPGRKATCDTAEKMRAVTTDLLHPNELTDAGQLVDAWKSGSTVLPALPDDVIRKLPPLPEATPASDEAAARPPAKSVAKREFSALDSWMSGEMAISDGTAFAAVLSVFDGTKRRGYLQLLCPKNTTTGAVLVLSPDLFDAPLQPRIQIEHFNGSRVNGVSFGKGIGLPVRLGPTLNRPSPSLFESGGKVLLTADILGSGNGTYRFRLDRPDDAEIIIRQRVSRTDAIAKIAMAEFNFQKFKPTDLRTALLGCQSSVKSSF